MEDGETLSLEQIRAFLEASGEVRFQAHDRRELYEWVNQTLRRQDYGKLKREGKGLVRRYLAKMTGLSRAQVARLIRCYQRRRRSEAATVPAALFSPRLYPSRHRTAGRSRRGPRNLERSGHPEDSCCAAESPACIVPITCPAGNPGTEVPAQTPRSPLIMLGPVLVTAAPTRTAKFAVLAGAVGGTVGQGAAKLVLFCNSVGI